MDLKKAIYDRRSVRNYADQPVDRATIIELLKAAAQAPSAMNLQPWVFVVVQDTTQMKRYSDRAKGLVVSTKLGSLSAELKDLLADPAFNIFYNAGTLVVICAKPTGMHPDWDCCFAAQNLMLAAHGMGLGTCPIGFAWPLLEQSDVKRELNIPAEYVAVLPLVLGYPHEPTPATNRKEPEILYWK